MIEKFAWFIVGFSLGYALSVQAFDPCNKPYSPEATYEKSRQYYNPNDDPAMHFHWRDGQPSLHPK